MSRYFLHRIICLTAALVTQLFVSPRLVTASDHFPSTRLERFERAALREAGNSANGKILFFDEQRTKCSTCHRVDQLGGEVGPDLTKIGGKFDRPHLIESLLEPSRQIVEGYRPTSLLTVDGQLVSGIVKSRDAEHVHGVRSDGSPFRLAVDEIDEEQVSQISLMPAGIETMITESEFTDLVAYLETLRNGDASFGAGTSGPIAVPKGFTVETVATGLNGAVAMEVLPDGNVLIAEQPGNLRLVRNDQLLENPVYSFPVILDWERGLIGVTVAPNYSTQPYVYVCYVTGQPYPHHVVSRILVDGDFATAGAEEVLFKGDDQRQYGGNVPAGHQGGGIHFGSDGCLYLGIGEQTAGDPAQRLDNLLGKILRLNADGSIPADNPLTERTSGKYQSIWAYGLRNPFSFAFHPASGDLLLNDVGGTFEEINRGVAGGNYGWPHVDHGPTKASGIESPIHIYPQSSIGGSDFVPDTADWPDEWKGKYLFADFVQGWIRAIDPATSHAVENNVYETFATGLRRPVDIRFTSGGELLVLLRNAWVADDKFENGTGSLLRIKYDP